MAIIVGPGITVGPGICIGDCDASYVPPPPGPTFIGSPIITELDLLLATEDGDILIAE